MVDPLSERRGSLIGWRGTWRQAFSFAREFAHQHNARLAVFYGNPREFSDQPPLGWGWWVAFGPLHPRKVQLEWEAASGPAAGSA